ncbi:hypothetical protein BU26DRAFT_61571 [Trematosphaeria pertusa]|uniref:Uncharacterized protein n=1 Tax=Trematosphaeria pertusa TaxID=390896 RepID=A0A6A6I696_9PLEO|nr:uncharacterized protein BU26DRAFT_61571 [Trematosphaeria pertusa]KAF2246074.1 hypothetical protein BU26DRAFT_61571 [Trematosphaeria pertusa]
MDACGEHGPAINNRRAPPQLIRKAVRTGDTSNTICLRIPFHYCSPKFVGIEHRYRVVCYASTAPRQTRPCNREWLTASTRRPSFRFHQPRYLRTDADIGTSWPHVSGVKESSYAIIIRVQQEEFEAPEVAVCIPHRQRTKTAYMRTRRP